MYDLTYFNHWNESEDREQGHFPSRVYSPSDRLCLGYAEAGRERTPKGGRVTPPEKCGVRMGGKEGGKETAK